MPAPPLVAFRLTFCAAHADAVAEALWEAGSAGFEELAEQDGRSGALAYFPAEILEADVASRLIGIAELHTAEVPQVDWVYRFRAGFTAFSAGGFLIVPEWDRGPGCGSDRTLVVDPGRAFGTGTHETTQLCLEALTGFASEGPLGRAVDIGTGTGILAIAAAKLGSGRPVAVDNDDEAISSAVAHARLNGVDLAVVHADGGAALCPRAFDLVLANISAPLLTERAAEIGALLRPGGRAVVSGFLVEDVPRLRPRFAQLGPIEERRLAEWAALVIRRAPG
jgi:ribosomal protein L11 methyltransferase